MFSSNIIGLCYLKHNCTLNTLLEQLAAVLVNTADATRRVISVCRAAARAIKSCPAISAGLSCIGVAGTELVLHVDVAHTVEDVAKLILLVTNELMAGI